MPETEKGDQSSTAACPPEWLDKYLDGLVKKTGIKAGEELLNLNMKQLTERIGGDISQLPYEYLQLVLPEGSDNTVVSDFIRQKRKEWREAHNLVADDEIAIGYDGSVVPYKTYLSWSLAKRRGFVVGPTCWHWDKGRKGMSDEDEPADI